MEPNDLRTEQIKQRATQLREKLRTLETLKHSTTPRPEIHTTTNNTGPRTPGNTTAIELSIDIEQCLMEICCDARNHIEPHRSFNMNGIELTSWIDFNAALIAELDHAPDIADDLRTLIRRADNYINRDSLQATRPEQRQTAGSICYQLHSTGFTQVTPQHLTTWAARGHISKTPRGYLLTEVMTWLTREK